MEDVREIAKEKKKIRQEYINFFQRLGYHSEPPVSFITQDSSLLFTNATIVPWKKYASYGQIPNKGVFVNPHQPCLRLHVLEDKLESSSILETRSQRLLGYFNMVGVLCEEEKANSLPLDVLSLLTDSYRTPLEKIRIFVSEENDFINSLDGKVKIMRGTEAKEEYNWTYGNNCEMSGVGAKIRLLQRDGGFVSVGQIIKINSKNKVTFEFGFGVETFLSRSRSEPDYNVWTISHCLPEKYRFKTLLDLTSCFGAACTIDPNQLTRKHRKEIVRLARRIILAEKLFNIPQGLIEDSVNKFINIEFNYNAENHVKDILKHARDLIREDERTN